MSRKPSYNKTYMRKYYSKHKNRTAKKTRDNDRYAHIKKNGKIPKGKELHHKNSYAKWKTRVVSRKKNRQLWAKTTLRVRKKVN